MRVIRQQLEEALGITGQFETLPSAAGYAKYGTSRSADSEGIWEIACQGDWMVVYNVGAIYLRGGTRNYTGWPNDKMVDWFERQKVEQEPEARREIDGEAEIWLNSFDDNHWITLQLGVLLWMVPATSRASTLLRPHSTSSSTRTCGWTASRLGMNTASPCGKLATRTLIEVLVWKDSSAAIVATP